MLNLDTLCNNVCTLARETGSYIATEAKNFDLSAVEYKGKNDLVSYVDKTAEKKLVAGLQLLIPDSGFITEEKTISEKNSEFTWIIDPLDGTTNFTHGLPCFCISIGLMKDNNILLGVIYEVNSKECFYAWKDGGAFLNGKKINVSAVKKLEHSLLATGFPSRKYGKMKEYMEVFDWCMLHTHGLRRLGSAAVDLAWVACGRFEGFYEYGLNPWDVAAGAFIIEEAGGTVTDFSGNRNYLFGEEIIACNKNVHAEFLNVVKEKFRKISL